MNDEEKTQLNILFKNYKGVPFTDKDISYLEENEIVGISGNAMFQNDYIIFESILMDKIPKGKNTVFTFYPPDDGSPNETFSGENYDSKLISENIKSTFIEINKSCVDLARYWNLPDIFNKHIISLCLFQIRH